MLPSHLLNFNFYANDTDYRGVINEVTLPEINRKIEEHRGGGMIGPAPLDFGSEGLEASIKVAGWQPSLLTSLGSRMHDAFNGRFMGGLNDSNSDAMLTCEVVMRGRITKFSPGSSKPGEPTEQEITYGLTYYKLVISGATVLEIDLVNGIYIVDGVDREADLRTAMGM